jgi:hypothetical protein
MWPALAVAAATSGRTVAKEMKARERKCKQNSFYSLLFLFRNLDISKGWGRFK